MLTELGIAATAEVLEYPTPVYGDLDEALVAFEDLLELPATPETMRQLREALELWLVVRRDGRLRVPGKTSTYAALSWRPRCWQPTSRQELRQ